jgi:hypothetical protein
MTKRTREPAKRHARKAYALWRRHKARAALLAMRALAEMAAWAALTIAARAWKASPGTVAGRA